MLVYAEHEVHILYCLTHGTFEEVVDDTGDDGLIAKLIDMHECFVGVDYLLQIECLVHVVGEGCIGIERTVHLGQLLCRGVGGCTLFTVELHHLGAEDAAGEVATIGNEVDGGLERTLQFGERLTYLVQMLVGEHLIDAHIVGAPAEVCGAHRLLTCTGRAGDGVYSDIVGEQSGFCQGQQTELYAGGKATGISQMLALADLLTVYLGQAVHIVVCGSRDAEVLRQVDDLHMLGDGVLLQELLALAMAETEEYHIHLIEGHGVGETQVGIAQEALVHVGHEVACIALAVGKDDFRLRMVHQEADEFATGISGSTKYSYFNHAC